MTRSSTLATGGLSARIPHPKLPAYGHGMRATAVETPMKPHSAIAKLLRIEEPSQKHLKRSRYCPQDGAKLNVPSLRGLHQGLQQPLHEGQDVVLFEV